jgi:hypothetical protein
MYCPPFSAPQSPLKRPTGYVEPDRPNPIEARSSDAGREISAPLTTEIAAEADFAATAARWEPI